VTVAARHGPRYESIINENLLATFAARQSHYPAQAAASSYTDKHYIVGYRTYALKHLSCVGLNEKVMEAVTV